MMEGLNNLRPNLVQQLLEACQSVKVKRLFLYMAEKSGHDWVKYLNLEKINMGSGKRSIVKNGVYVSKYQIIISKELENHGKESVEKTSGTLTGCSSRSGEGGLFCASRRHSYQSFCSEYASPFCGHRSDLYPN